MFATQKQAVFVAVKRVFASMGIAGKRGQPAAELMNDAAREEIVDRIQAGLDSGDIPLIRDVPDTEDYAARLLANWLKRDSRLNGKRAA